MLKRVKSRWWYVYLALQLVGLFHAFFPLPFHYRHVVGRYAILPLLPGGPIALMLDWVIRSGGFVLYRIPPLRFIDELLIGIVTLAINCGLFALLIVLVRWAVGVRKRSWRSNAYSID